MDLHHTWINDLGCPWDLILIVVSVTDISWASDLSQYLRQFSTDIYHT